jgi:hypothetical protein
MDISPVVNHDRSKRVDPSAAPDAAHGDQSLKGAGDELRTSPHFRPQSAPDTTVRQQVPSRRARRFAPISPATNDGTRRDDHAGAYVRPRKEDRPTPYPRIWLHPYWRRLRRELSAAKRVQVIVQDLAVALDVNPLANAYGTPGLDRGA